MSELLAVASGELTLGGDMTVRRMGFGAMRITGEGVWGAPKDHAGSLAVLRRSIELGVNLIDTADAYGPEVSENLIAEALYPYPTDLVIATKGGYTRQGPGQWTPDGRPEHLRAALDGSLKRLKLERIDLYQFHTPDPKVPFEESIGTLVDLQKAGKIRHLGLSNVSVDQLNKAREMINIVSVQNRYNLADRASESVLDACEKLNIGFIPWFPLAVGQLAQSGGKLDEIAHRYNAMPSQIALAWLLKRSPVMLPIPGTSSVKHLEENMAGSLIQLSEEDFQALNQN